MNPGNRDQTPPTWTPEDDQKLLGYLLGESTPAECADIEHWITAHPERQARWRQLSAEWQNVPLRRDEAYDVTAALARVKMRSEHRHSATVRRTDLARSTAQRRYWVSVAISSIAAVAVLLTWPTRSIERAKATTYHTAPGQRSTVRLADGSTIMLAPGTSVVSTGERFDVTGEAYFTVAPHSNRPFVVHTKNTRVQVLGTRFTVRQYAGERTTVVVEDGKVSLQTVGRPRTKNAPTVVSNGMLALVTDSGVTVTSGITTKDYTSWTQGILKFERIPLANVIAELGRAYGAEIRISDTTLAKVPVVMEVSVSEDLLWQTLTRICLASDAHVVRNGRAYVLVPGQSPRDVHRGPASDAPRRNTFPQPDKQYGR
jgi:transmembrane sensor